MKGAEYMIPANLKAAMDIISGQIREYETTDTTELRDIQADIICTSLSVLSAATGYTYNWTRREMPNGKLYSAVCRLKKTGNDYDVYDNCAING